MKIHISDLPCQTKTVIDDALRDSVDGLTFTASDQIAAAFAKGRTVVFSLSIGRDVLAAAFDVAD